MPTISLNINITVPEGADVEVTVDREDQESVTSGDYPAEVSAAIDQLAPGRYQPFIRDYLDRAIHELGCTVEEPSGNRTDYINVFAPPRCRRARVASIYYKTSRISLFAEPVDLSGYELATETLNNGNYVHPKVPHLGSEQAVDEAIELTKLAIERFER